jgi:uncharacterized protein YjbI with pentapeptide repeats
MEQKELKKILSEHKRWLKSGGKTGTKANLHGLELIEADLQNVDLQDADLVNVNLTGANLQGANLSRANMEESFLRQANLTNSNLKEINLQKSDLQEADLTNADLDGANLKGARLWLAKLTKASLINANLESADLKEACLKEAVLKKASMWEANLQKANLEGATLFGTYLYGASLQGANLKNADLQEADLHDSDLYGADLKGANLRSADMRRANMLKAIIDEDTVLEDARLAFIIIDEETIESIPTEIQGLYRYSWDIRDAEGKPINTEPIIQSIEFPPEHHQAVVEVLSYFGKILHDKYPPKTFKFRVEQGDFRATMIIETDTEHRESIVNTLEEYGQVLTGSITPEEFADTKLQLIEIKRFLKHLNDHQKELSSQVSSHHEAFLPIINQLTPGKAGPSIEGLEYAVYVPNPTGIGTERRPEKEKRISTKYLNDSDAYDILVYHMNVKKKVGIDKKEFESIELDRSLLNLLVLFLKYKDRPLPYLKLYHKAWEGSAHYNYKANDPLEVMDNLKGAVHQLRTAFNNVDGFHIPKARGGTYTCKGKFKFCLILDRHFDETYTLEEV